MKAAYAKAEREGIDYTDDCAAVEAIGKHIYTCDGENTNIKITTPDDLILAEGDPGGARCLICGSATAMTSTG